MSFTYKERGDILHMRHSYDPSYRVFDSSDTISRHPFRKTGFHDWLFTENYHVITGTTWYYYYYYTCFFKYNLFGYLQILSGKFKSFLKNYKSFLKNYKSFSDIYKSCMIRIAISISKSREWRNNSIHHHLVCGGWR